MICLDGISLNFKTFAAAILWGNIKYIKTCHGKLAKIFPEVSYAPEATALSGQLKSLRISARLAFGSTFWSVVK